MNNRLILRGFVASAIFTGAVAAQDNLVLLIDEDTATGGAAIGSFGYDPTTDSAYIGSFGASGSLRKVSGVSTPTPSFTTMVSEAQWNLYYRDGDPNTSAGTPLPGGLLLNPQQIGAAEGSIPAYSRAWIADGVRVPASGTVNAQKSKRIYSYNLQQVQPNPDPKGPIPTEPPYYDGRDVFTTRLTLAQMNTIAGLPADNATSNMFRQFAWSSDGLSLYFTDSGNSTGMGGVWKHEAESGATSRIWAGDSQTVEPAIKQLSPGVDRIFIRGTSATGNDSSGIDYLNHDGTITSAPAMLLAGQTVRDFLETTAAVNITSIAADPQTGDLFFNVSGGSGATQRRVVLRYSETAGLSKITSYEERDLKFTGAVGGSSNPNTNTAKLQPYVINFAGAEGSFPLTQILYAEQSGLNLVAAMYAFKPGDFDRDNDVDQDDIALFKPKLTVRGQAAATLDLKYDMTGNGAVDWWDVQTLQNFYDFRDGDANIDQLVNSDDFNLLATNFGLGGKVWTQGDFTGDNLVNSDDFNVLASNFGLAPAIGEPTPQQWAALAAAVPEPVAILPLAGLASAAAMRCRRRRIG